MRSTVARESGTGASDGRVLGIATGDTGLTGMIPRTTARLRIPESSSSSSSAFRCEDRARPALAS